MATTDIKIESIPDLFSKDGRITTHRASGKSIWAYRPQNWSEDTTAIFYNNYPVSSDHAKVTKAAQSSKLVFVTIPKAVGEEGETVAKAIPATAAALGATAAVTFGLSIGIAFALHALSRSGAQDVEKEEISSFNPSVNTVVPGTPIRVGYGEHKNAGHIISQITERKNNKSFLKVLIALGHGEIESIANIDSDRDLVDRKLIDGMFINGEPIANYGKVKVSFRMGTSEQTILPGFEKTAVLIDLDDEPLSSEMPQGVALPAVNNANELTIFLKFPDGLIRLGPRKKRGGSKSTASVKFRVDIRKKSIDGGGDWETVLTKSVGGRTNSVVLRELVVPNLPLGRYDVRIRKLTKDDKVITSRGTIGGGAPGLQQIAFITNRVVIDGVAETIYEDFTYPGIALIGVDLVGTDQLNGNVPNITVNAKHKKIHVHDGTPVLVGGVSVPKFDFVYSRNPAWVIFDVLTNRTYGAGNFISLADINIMSFLEAADFCDEQVWDGKEGDQQTGTVAGSLLGTSLTGSGTLFIDELKVGDFIRIAGPGARGFVRVVDTITSNVLLDVTEPLSDTFSVQSIFIVETEDRCQYDGIFDAQKPVWDQIRQIAATARLSVIRSGRQVKLFIDRAANPVGLITLGNSTAVVKHFTGLNDKPNVVSTRFLNRELEYNQDSALEDILDVDDSDRYNTKTISRYGIVRASQAHRASIYYLKAQKFIRTGLTIKVGIDSIHYEPGDILTIAHHVVHPNSISGRVTRDSGAATLFLDREVVISSGSEAVFVSTSGTGVDVLQNVAISSGFATFPPDTLLTVTPAWDGGDGPKKGDVYSFSRLLNIEKDFRIISIQESENMTALIKLAEYDDRIYEDTPSIIESFTQRQHSNLRFPPEPTNVLVEDVDGNLVISYEFQELTQT